MNPNEHSGLQWKDDVSEEREIKKIIKEKRDDAIKPFLESVELEDRYDICWYVMADKLKYVTPNSLKNMLLMCEKLLNKSWPLEYLLINKRFDLVSVYLECGVTINEKIIEKFERQYKDTFDPKPSKVKSQCDSSSEDIEDERARYREILDWIQSNNIK